MRTRRIPTQALEVALDRCTTLQLRSGTRGSSKRSPLGCVVARKASMSPRLNASRRAKLSGAYLAQYERALAWVALPTAEMAERQNSRRGGATARGATLGFGLDTDTRRLGGVVTQRPAKPFTPVRFR